MTLAGSEAPWGSEKILYDGDAYFEHLIRDIEAAKTEILLESYIFQNDETGRKVSAALVQAAGRGVLTRLIVDGIGASGWYEKNAPRLEELGVKVRVYHPVLFFNLWSRLKIDLGFPSPTGEKFRGSALISRLNRRDHRKMAVIDGRIGYVGSVNVTDDHSAQVRGDKAWRDTTVRVEGGAIAEMQAAFHDVWLRCHDAHARGRWKERLTQTRRRASLSKYIRFNHTRKLRKANYRSLLRRISRAKKRILLTNPYFAPSRLLLRALARASKNGADVRILVPRESDVFFMPWVVRANYSIVLKSGARVFEYCPRMLHAKTAVIDNWAIIGSSNFNRRSLRNDFEVDLVLSHSASRDELVQAFERDLKEAEEVHEAERGIVAWAGRIISIVLKNWI